MALSLLHFFLFEFGFEFRFRFDKFAISTVPKGEPVKPGGMSLDSYCNSDAHMYCIACLDFSSALPTNIVALTIISFFLVLVFYRRHFQKSLCEHQ
jgi:hypothetical protein